MKRIFNFAVALRYATFGVKDYVAYYGNAFELEDCSVVVLCGIESGVVVYSNQTEI